MAAAQETNWSADAAREALSVRNEAVAPLALDAAPERHPRKSFTLPFDPLRVIDAIHSCRWMVILSAGIFAIGAGIVGFTIFNPHHIAEAQLIKQGPGNSFRQSEGGDPYQPRETSVSTLMTLMRSGVLMEKTATLMEGTVSESELREGLTIISERNTDILRISLNSDVSSAVAAKTLQHYISEVLTLTRDLQQHDAGEMNRVLQSQITQTNRDLLKMDQELLDYARREGIIDADKQTDAWLGELGSYALKLETIRLDFETVDLKISGIERELAKVSPAAAKLQTAREELAQLQLRYTEAHPTVLAAAELVKAQEAAMRSEKPQLNSPPKPGESAVAESLYLELIKLRGDKEVLGEQLDKLKRVRSLLDERLADLPRKTLGLAEIKSRKSALENARDLLAARQRESALAQNTAQGSFRLLGMSREQDVIVEKPMKKILLLAFVGGLLGAGLVAAAAALRVLLEPRLMSAGDLKRVTLLPVLGGLSLETASSASAASEWGFHTWTSLSPSLAVLKPDGAVVCGLLSEGQGMLPHILGRAASQRGAYVVIVSTTSSDLPSASISTIMQDPKSLLDHLGQPGSEMLHIELDEAWEWSAAQRQQWNEAMAIWGQARNTVVIVELLSPQKPETLLAAEGMPNLLWVSTGGESMQQSVRSQMKLYRAAGCRLVGALLDRASAFRLGMLNKLAAASACLLLMMLGLAKGADSVKLGAGDIINISVAGQPELARNGVTVAPDGTITYLQAQGLPASGLSIDELRIKLSVEVQRFYKNALVMVTPNLFQSRKVYVLGKIVKKGAINLDRPMTVLEIVAEAGGLETGLFQQNTVELADLGRSFLARGNQRVPIDMEALFLKGDMKQNVAVQAGDYLYFPSANSNEIYVLGNVKMQGSQGLLAHTSVHSAIAQAGGCTPKAYLKRILVVRGSLQQPKTFVVNLEDIMNGRSKGFRLEPKDIVYVADRPWARAEELLSFALNAFLQGAVSSWAGANVGPLIKDAILPSMR